MTSAHPQPAIGGYVLAGGKSSRMGRDKALLELAGQPLILLAVRKLRRLCAQIHILSANPDLQAFAPLVPDLHPDCGPLGGIEAALLHSNHDRNLILPVDLPFLPTALLDSWMRTTMRLQSSGTRLAMFKVEEKPQPTLLVIHRDLTPYVSRALAQGQFKLLPALEAATQDLAAKLAVPPTKVCRTSTLDEQSNPLYFANLNTPEDFAEAAKHLHLLDPDPSAPVL